MQQRDEHRTGDRQATQSRCTMATQTSLQSRALHTHRRWVTARVWLEWTGTPGARALGLAQNQQAEASRAPSTDIPFVGWWASA